MRATLIVLLLFSSLSFADSCEDTDGGNKAKIQGTVLMRVGSSAQEFISKETDSCKDKKHLIEYYCKDNVSITEIVTCPKACKKGACL